MPVTLIGTPERNIGTSTTVSKLNNVHQPIWFVFKREDFQVSSITNDAGKVKITISGTFTSFDGGVDDYLKLVTSQTAYNGTWKITAITTNTITIDLPYISNATGYFNMLGRKNWFVITYVSVKLPSGDIIPVGNLETRQNQNDECHVNVAPLLKSYVLMNDTFEYNTFSYADVYESNQYQVSYQEYFTGSDIPSEKRIDFYFINSVNQPRYRSGSNMEYYMFGNKNNLIKWLTPFVRPTAFKGFPFCMSFINFTDRFNVYQFETHNDTTIDTLVTADKPYLNRTMLETTNTSLGGEIEVQLRANIELEWVNFSEKIIVDFNTECHKSPIYLNWLDTTGGRAFWLFDRVQTVVVDTAVGDTFEPLVSNLKEQQGDVFEVERFAGNKLVLTTYTTIEKAKGIKSMLYSLNVLMLVNPDTWETDGVVWEAVRPLAGSYQLYNTNETHTSLTVTIELMATNIQSR